MYTMGAIGLLVLSGWIASRNNRQDEPSRHDDSALRDIIRHTRQDMRFACYLLGSILVMLGFLADRIR